MLYILRRQQNFAKSSPYRLQYINALSLCTRFLNFAQEWVLELSSQVCKVHIPILRRPQNFAKISTLLLSVCTVDQSKVVISHNFVAFSVYTNFKVWDFHDILSLIPNFELFGERVVPRVQKKFVLFFMAEKIIKY